MNNQELFDKLSKKRQQLSQSLQDPAIRNLNRLLQDIYVENAHFVYELIQNADDFKATFIKFSLQKNGLFFIHNGSVKFSITDVDLDDNHTPGHINSITSIANSNQEVENRIGKFGIGFKSVFQYTATPIIQDDNFSFIIKDLIVPYHYADNFQLRKNGETLFYFPFNLTQEANNNNSFEDIAKKLSNIDKNILLFLRNIVSIDILIEREKENSISIKKELIPKQTDINHSTKFSFYKIIKDDEVYNYLLFYDLVIEPGSNSEHQINVVYLLDNNSNFIPSTINKAYCFFPTQEVTDLKFILHAPFLLTNNRQNIQRNKLWNLSLIQSIESLVVKSLDVLKLLNLLNRSFFDIIPLVENSSKENLFNNYFNAIRESFLNNEYLPIEDNKYISTKNAVLGVGENLINFLDHQGLQAFRGNTCAYFLFKDLKDSSEPQLWNFLRKYLNIDLLDSKTFVLNLTSAFVSSLSFTKLIELYTFLSTLSPDASKLRPIIKTKKGNFLAAFLPRNNVPQIFLESDEDDLEVVHPDLLQNQVCYNFFKSLGLGSPDIRDIIFTKVINRYKMNVSQISPDQYLRDFEKVFNYYQSADNYKRNELKIELNKIPFVASKGSSVNGSLILSLGSNLFFPDNILSILSWAEKFHFVDSHFYQTLFERYSKEDIKSFLKFLGVHSDLYFNHDYNSDTNAIIISRDLDIRATRLNPATDHSIFGHDIILDHLRMQYLHKRINDSDINLSSHLWNFLKINIREVEYYKQGSFEYTFNRRKYLMHFDSALYLSLIESRWLFTQNLELKTPSEITYEELHSSYSLENSDQLIEFLGIQKNSDEQRFENLTDEEKAFIQFGKSLNLNNLSQEKLDQIKKIISEPEKLTSPSLPFPEPEDSNEITIPVKVPKEESQKSLEEILKGSSNNNGSNQNPQNIDNPNPQTPSAPEEKPESEITDQDELTPKPVLTQDQLDKIEEELKQKVLEKTKLEEQKAIAAEAEPYSLKWFDALLNIEYFQRSDNEKKTNPFFLRFTNVAKDPHSDQIITLSGINYIPSTFEDNGDLSVTIHYKNNSKSLLAEAFSRQNKSTKIKLLGGDADSIDISNILYVDIELKNVNFIYENLKSAFTLFHNDPFNLIDDYNFQKNLPENIQFIFGPPGTGKTTYLANNIVAPFVKDNENFKILILTPTNKAADVITNKIIAKSEQDKHDYHNWLVRFGLTNDESIEYSDIFYSKKELLPKHLHKCCFISTIARFPYDQFKVETKSDTYDFHIKNFNWDIVIFDEASMINLPSVVYAIFYLLQKNPDIKFIFGGDPHQIAPIVYADEPNWKDGNIYSMVGLNKKDSFSNPQTLPHVYEVVNLETQYRSTPVIGKLFSDLTYNGKLQHHRQLIHAKNISIDKLEVKPLTIIDFHVDQFISFFKPMKLKNSPYHIYSALFTIEVLQHVLNTIKIENNDPYSIGIICPYRAQHDIINKLLPTINIPINITVSTGTIHGFQGDESDMIISLFNPPSFISKSENCFLNKQHIVNVSISRARDYLVMLMPIGDNKYLKTDELFLLNEIRKIISINPELKNNFIHYNSHNIENLLFGSKNHLENISFPTSHQDVNIYSNLDKKYEIRFSESAVDIQIKNGSK